VRTVYPHWSGQSGYSLIINGLRKAGHCLVEFKKELGEKAATTHSNAADTLVREAASGAYTYQDLKNEFQLLDYLMKYDADVVHFLDPEHGYYYSHLLAQRGVVDIVATFHQPAEVLESLYSQNCNHDFLRNLTRIIILNENQRSFFRGFKPNDHIVTIPHGVKTEYFKPRHSFGKKNFKVLTVGHWLRDLDLVMGTIELCNDAEIIFQLVGVEKGIKTAAQQNMYARIRERDNVEIFENVSDDELLLLYQNADIGFLPFEYTTANNVVLELMACGVPILTTIVDGIDFYLNDDITYFIPQREPKKVLDIIETCRADRKKLSTMANMARQQAVATYDWPEIVKKHEALYASMLSSSRRYCMDI